MNIIKVLNYYFKYVNCVVCELYLNEVIIKEVNYLCLVTNNKFFFPLLKCLTHSYTLLVRMQITITLLEGTLAEYDQTTYAFTF